MGGPQVGLFDPPSDSPWADLGADTLNSSHAQNVAYEAALQGMVLLTNKKGALPLKGGGIQLAVVGPLGDDATGLKSDYEGAGDQNTDTIFGALSRLNTGGSTVFQMGVGVSKASANGTAAALAAVKAADVTVLVVGLTKAQEHEGMDRKDTLLPAVQESFAAAVFAAAGSSKPVVVILCNGGAVSIDALVSPAAAIIEAFNPAQQGPRALASLLFGHENRWGWVLCNCVQLGVGPHSWLAQCSALQCAPLISSHLIGLWLWWVPGSYRSQSTTRVTAARWSCRTWSTTRLLGARTATTPASHSSLSAQGCP